MKKMGVLPRIYLIFILLLTYVPVFLVIIYSFNESKLSSVWTGFSLTWYEQLFRDESIFEALGNTVILGLLSSGLAGVIGTLGAFGMARSRFKGKGSLEYVSNMPIMIPEIILGMVFMAFFSLLNLPFGMVTLVIAHTAFCIPYVYMLVKARLAGFDKNLEDAARDLGASPARAFFDITLPLLAPAVVSGMLLAFAMSIDDVIISVFVTGVEVNTLPIKIYTQLKTGVTPKTNALCTLMFIASLILCGIAMLLGRPPKSEKKEKKS